MNATSLWFTYRPRPAKTLGKLLESVFLSLIDTYRSILSLLEPRERRQYGLLVAVTLAMAVIDMFSIAAIVPFLAIVTNPSILHDHAIFVQISSALGLTNRRSFLVVLGVCVFAIVILGILGRAVSLYAMTRFSRLRALSIAVKLMRLFLRRSYLWHVERDSADLGRKALDEVREVVNGPLNASLRLLANMSVFVLVMMMLIALQPIGAIVASCLVAACYGGSFLIVQNRVSTMGKEWQLGNAYRYRIMQEALGGIREVKLFGLQNFYVERYRGHAERVARTVAKIHTFGEMPRLFLEAVAFGGMLLFLIVLLVTGDGNVSKIVPVLGAYAFAGVRLFPIVQSIYRDYTTLRMGEAMVESLHLELSAADRFLASHAVVTSDNVCLPFEQAVEARDIGFTFPGSDRPALSQCSFRVDRGTMIGFAGATGAGKSTLIDILSGLIPPDRGEVCIDGQRVDESNAHAWRTQIGYVPQSIFLVEDTIAHNIAFGLDPRDVDMDRVRDAARMAQIDDFIGSLPDGYETRAGERGKRMSGGQRQRIAIARALYRRPSLLIFDEATSALDPGTEVKVMQAITEMAGDLSIVLIAHRLTTLRRCETIHVLDRGRIVQSGAYGELREHSSVFRTLEGVVS